MLGLNGILPCRSALLLLGHEEAVMLSGVMMNLQSHVQPFLFIGDGFIPARTTIQFRQGNVFKSVDIMCTGGRQYETVLHLRISELRWLHVYCSRFQGMLALDIHRRAMENLH